VILAQTARRGPYHVCATLRPLVDTAHERVAIGRVVAEVDCESERHHQHIRHVVQAESRTVASLVVALRERITPDGLLLPDALQSEPTGASLTCVESLPSHVADLGTVSAPEQIQNRLKILSDLRLDRCRCRPVVQSCATS
jgi:hypothetical protein